MATTNSAVSPEDVQDRPEKGQSRQAKGQLGPVRASDRDKLTIREREFIGACCTNGFKPTEACRQLGFGGNWPENAASKMLKRAHVKAEFDRRAAAKEAKHEITVDRIAQRYAELAFAAHEGPLTASNVIQALDALGKYRGMFKQEQVTVVPVTFQFIGGPDLALDVTPKPAPEALASSSMADTDGTGIGKPTPR